MRILAACSLGGAGHLQPLVPLLDAARRDGHDTLVVGPPALRDLVAAAGHPFRPGGEPREVEVAAIRERLPGAPPDEASVLGNRELFGRLATDAMLPRMERAIAEWRPDVVLRDPCEYASAIVTEARSIPAAQVAISLAEVEDGSLVAAEPALEEHHAGLTNAIRAAPYLSRFPASLDPSPFPTTSRYREDRREPGHEPEALPDWWQGSDAPLLYATFGTVLGHMTIAAEVYDAVLEAVADLDVRVLLTVGRAFDRSGLTSVASNVRVEAWVDQRRALADADAVLCHGGSGTAFGALAAGLPLVLVPLFADQFENAHRISGRGAGVVAHLGMGEPSTRDTSDLDTAVGSVLGDGAFADAAAEISAEMAGAPRAGEVLRPLSDRARPGR